MNKSLVTDDATVKQVFSHLNVKQIKHILDNFQADEYVMLLTEVDGCRFSPEGVPESAKLFLYNEVLKTNNKDLQLKLDASFIPKKNVLTS